jgi:hypothetical protein
MLECFFFKKKLPIMSHLDCTRSCLVVEIVPYYSYLISNNRSGVVSSEIVACLLPFQE